MELKYKYDKIKHIRHNIKLIHIYIHINHIVKRPNHYEIHFYICV